MLEALDAIGEYYGEPVAGQVHLVPGAGQTFDVKVPRYLMADLLAALEAAP